MSTSLFFDMLSHTAPSLLLQSVLVFALLTVLITKELVRIITPSFNHAWMRKMDVIIHPLLLIFCIIIFLNVFEIMVW